ncbi:MAG: hypothetical protein Q4E53_00685 [Eubacteriales bacterium]|nr:hypothetical protein [Eubacteriales bacterium]
MRREIAQIIRQDKVMELVYGNNSSPKDILGRHMIENGQVISCYHPDAVKMCILDDDDHRYEMDPVERHPIYAAFFPHKDEFHYRVEMTFRDGNILVSEDPYSFASIITDEEEQLFIDGEWYDCYEKMGAHPMTLDGVAGIYFAVWAPNATRVSVIGDFNYWNGMICPMQKREKSGIFELFVPRIQSKSLYRFEIKSFEKGIVRKVDPLGTIDLNGSGDTSIVLNVKEYVWKDEEWMRSRKEKNWKKFPFALCEREFLDRFREEVSERECFTHVLLKAPDFCHGTRGKIREWIDDLHRRGIGVILQMATGFFPEGECGLSSFDGSNLYDHTDERIRHDWKKHRIRFDHSKKMVNGYIMSYLFFWMREFHVDGFLFKDMTDMIYPSWKGEGDEKTVLHQKYSDRFLRKAVKAIKKEDFSVLVIADEKQEIDTHYSELLFSKDGFDLLINYSVPDSLLGYLHSSIDKPSKDYYKLALPMMKNGIRKTVLNVSLDDIHSDELLLQNEAFLNEYDKISWKKLTMGYLMGVPSRKRWTWNDTESAAVENYLKKLFNIYMTHDSMYTREAKNPSFMWINGIDAPNAVMTFVRRSPKGERNLLYVCNFSRERKKASVLVYQKKAVIIFSSIQTGKNLVDLSEPQRIM